MVNVVRERFGCILRQIDIHSVCIRKPRVSHQMFLFAVLQLCDDGGGAEVGNRQQAPCQLTQQQVQQSALAGTSLP